MDTGVLFVFFALSSVLVTNVVTDDWPLIDTMFLRFYTRNNNSNIDMSLKNARDIVPMLNKSQTTVIYIHGYLEDVDSDTVKLITKVLLNSTSTNVFSLDYREVGILYPTSVEYVPYVGAALAAAIDDMAKAGLDGTAVHIIGHSLGAQICGYTGRKTAVKVQRISGLDPAGPLFFSGYLTKDDASFVCIIHTDMQGLGIGVTSGNVDFKVNLGYRLQPGCIADIPETLLPPGLCSHRMSLNLFVESIMNPNAFPSVKCYTGLDFVNGTCDTSSIIPMGYYTPNNVSGVYYCQSNWEPPYSLGKSGTVYKHRI